MENAPQDRKVGLFGGTFNPIHVGHLRGAEEIQEICGLDEVIFIPASLPPHKGGEELVGARNRLEMVKLATASNPRFSVSTVELERKGRSYSIDTIRHFRAIYPDSISFILGEDAFFEIETWKEFQNLFSLSDFIVMARPGCGRAPSAARLPKALASTFGYDEKQRYWVHTSGHTLRFQEITLFDVSSTRIRDLIDEGRSVKYLVPEKVHEYIRSHGLYRRKA